MLQPKPEEYRGGYNSSIFTDDGWTHRFSPGMCYQGKSLLEVHYVALCHPSINRVAYEDVKKTGLYWDSRKIKHILSLLIDGVYPSNSVSWHVGFATSKDVDKVINALGLERQMALKTLCHLGWWNDDTSYPATKEVMQYVAKYYRNIKAHGKRSRAKAAASR